MGMFESRNLEACGGQTKGLNWTTLNLNFQTHRPAQAQTTIHFPIKAAVEFVA
jgi:hypothetical protein